MRWNNRLHGADRRAPCTLLLRCSEKGVCRASWRPARTRAKLDVCSKHVRLPRRWGELEIAICQLMIPIGFVQGRVSPCIYRHLEKQLSVWVPGDDFVRRQCQMVLCEAARVVSCHESENPWPPGYHDCVQSMRVLGRIVERTAEGITWEAPRHAVNSSGNRSE